MWQLVIDSFHSHSHKSSWIVNTIDFGSPTPLFGLLDKMSHRLFNWAAFRHGDSWDSITLCVGMVGSTTIQSSYNIFSTFNYPVPVYIVVYLGSFLIFRNGSCKHTPPHWLSCKIHLFQMVLDPNLALPSPTFLSHELNVEYCYSLIFKMKTL